MHSLNGLRQQFQYTFNESHKRARIVIGLGTCGIAAGAEKVWTAVSNYIETQGLEIAMMATGCVGMCYAEPLMEVHLPGEPRFIYGNLKPENAVAILKRHLQEGSPSPEYIVAQDPRGYEAAVRPLGLNGAIGGAAGLLIRIKSPIILPAMGMRHWKKFWTK